MLISVFYFLAPCTVLLFELLNQVKDKSFFFLNNNDISDNMCTQNCISMWIFVGTFLWQKTEKYLTIFNPPLQSLHTIISFMWNSIERAGAHVCTLILLSTNLSILSLVATLLKKMVYVGANTYHRTVLLFIDAQFFCKEGL